MKASKKEMILSVVLCLLPIVLGLIMWKDLPERVPTHFDLNNQPDGYSSKAFAVFGLPILMAALDALCLFGLKSDPKADKHSKVLVRFMLWFIPGLCILLYSLCLLAAVGKNVNIALIMQLLIGVVFLIAGNYLPKCRRNYTMGIKLPWTLNSEENWNRTHRLAGFLWVIGGAAFILVSLLGVWNGWIFGVILAAMTLIPAVYSYLLYKKGI